MGSYHIIVFTILMIIHFGGSKVTEESNDNNKPHIPPHTMKFPYGDESQFNTDVTKDYTNTAICEDRTKFIPEFGRCPFPPDDPADMILTNPYIKCPVFPYFPHPAQAPPSCPVGDACEAVLVQCNNCDLKLTPDGSAVVVKCTGCYDLPSTHRTAEHTVKDILHTSYYIQIANYSSVSVQGVENYNP